MDTNLFLLLGGIGMFLLGMDVMTKALKEAAGSSLRDVLSRFTTTPLKGVVTGAAATAVIQSSSATTVMTVGFVGAGLMTLQQAMGIIYGANIGTTATGWLVSLLGFKLSLETLALAALLPASLANLLGQGKTARYGRMVAGLCLLLIGLDLMQDAAKDATDMITPDMLPGRNVLGVLGLAVIGMVVTLVIQSSSATMALALVFLQTGAINVSQAAAIVIGMNIGTTFTALLASVGGSRVMRRAALANLGFNIATSVIAFPLLALMSGLLLHWSETTGPLTALLLFHTGFNLVGTLLFLPLTDRYTAWITRLVPDPAGVGLPPLDRVLLAESGAALIAAQSGSAAIARRQYRALAEALRPVPDYRSLSALHPDVGLAIDDLERFLADVRLPDDLPQEEAVFSGLLHEADHLRRLLARAGQTAHIQTLLEDRALRRPALLLGAILNRAAQDDAEDLQPERLRRLSALVVHRTSRHRRGMLLGEHAGLYTLPEVFAHTDAMRWLQRVLHHAERIGHYDLAAKAGLRTEPPQT
ncbi:Na/Pi symporter [Seohaeicola saemankumensis]|nr:Na/Pi symporter [Seohaeicola saemankumensis]MCA0873092.1 Na/Pi symporter [Seohaeicola saemankumensis]